MCERSLTASNTWLSGCSPHQTATQLLRIRGYRCDELITEPAASALLVVGFKVDAVELLVALVGKLSNIVSDGKLTII